MTSETIEQLKLQLKEAIRLSKTDDQLLRQLAEEEIKQLISRLIEQDPLNKRGVVMEIRPATGGDEAELFAADLLRMYLKYADKMNWRISLINHTTTELNGIKSAEIMIKDPNAYEALRFESGIHRVQRVPITEKSGRVHTSAASVVVYPQAQEMDISIRPNDLRIDVFRSSGHGGQSVNTTDSAVRLTHLPTGIVVVCQDERSQFKNKEKAMTVLRSKLWQKKVSAEHEALSRLRREYIKSGDRSDKIRTYNLSQNRLTDHRVNHSWYNLSEILNGELSSVISYLRRHFLISELDD